MLRLELFPGSNEAFSRGVSRRRLVNWFPSTNPDTGRINLYPMPGYDVFATTGGSSWKGGVEFDDIGYAVVDTELKQIHQSGSVITVGTGVVGGQDRVDFAVGKTQIMLVDGTNGYVYTPSTDTFVTISDANFPANPTTCAHLDGYFVVDDPSNAGRWYRSEQNNATDWTIGSVAEFATAERSGDALKHIAEAGDKLWFLGNDTTELWFNASDPNTIFHRVNPISVDWGVDAPFSALEIDNHLIWLAKNKRAVGKVILTSPSGKTKIISPPWLESVFSSYAVRTDAFADSFDYKGHTFYILTFPTAGYTWVYDINTNEWFEWKNFSLTRHRSNGIIRVGDKFLVGDYANGNIYQLKDSVYTHNLELIEHIYRTDHIGQDNISLRWDVIEAVFQKGVGLSGTGQGSDPLCQLTWSKDQGNTWSDPDYSFMGKIGEYFKRNIFRNKGWSKGQMALELKVTEPVKTVLVDLYAEITPSQERPATI